MNFVTQNSKFQIPFKLQDTKFKLLLIAALFIMLFSAALPLAENNVKGDIGQYSIEIN